MQVLHTVTIPADNGLPEDDFVYSFAIDTDAPIGPGNVGELSIPVQQFFTQVKASGASLASLMSTNRDTGTNRMTHRTYDISGHLDGSPHGSPVATDFGTLEGAGSNVGLPEEVCAVLTLRGVGWSTALVETPDSGDVGTARDRPRQRRSGRIFFGPLISGTAVLATGANNRTRVGDTLRNTLLDAAEDLFDTLASFGHTWSVWSRTNAAFYRIVDAQVDDAFDIQRRRGPKPSVRTTRSISV